MAYSTQLYNKFNNYFPTDQTIDEVKHYIRTKEMPATVNTTTKRKRFREKFDDFIIKNDKLEFEPLHLVVVPKQDVPQLLEELYDRDDAGLGKGIVALYKFVRQHYINLTRKDVDEFIKGKTNYQLTHDFKHRINKPIISHFPNQIWGIDLIDMNLYEKTQLNNKYRYIMTVVDVFSRKVWLGKLRTKDAPSTAEAFAEIVKRAGVSPNHLLSDNGTEWEGEFAQLCRDLVIKQRFTRSYTPQANGITERANREIRKIIRAFFAKNANVVWANLLPSIEKNKNHSYNDSIKTSPDKIWTADKAPLRIQQLPDEVEPNYDENVNILKYNAQNHILRKVKADIKRFKDTELNVGDFVRVKMSAISTNVRREVKQGNTKQIVIRWSPIVFRITKKIVPRQPTLERSRYIVEDAEQNRVLFKRNRKASRDTIHPARLYASELLLMPSSQNNTNLTMADTYILNKVEPTRNDLQLGDEMEEVDYEPRYWVEEEPDYEPRYWNEEDFAEPRRSTRIREQN